MLRPVLAIVLGLAASAQAGTTLHVPQDVGSIQAAVDLAKAGDIVAVSPGWYRENVTVTTNGITLQGSKATLDGDYAGACLTVQADMVTVIGLGFANGVGGIELTGGGARLIDLSVFGSADFGIRFTGTGTVEKCRVFDCLGTGLVVETPDASGPLTLLTDNQLRRCGMGLLATRGPFLVDRNLAAGNGGDGLHLVMPTGETPSEPTWVTRNRSIGNGAAGLRVIDGVGGIRVILNNDLLDNGVGLDLTSSVAGTVVNRNDVKRNRFGGAFLRGSGMLVERNRIGRNSLVGLVVLSAGEGVEGNNEILSNKLQANGGDGLRIASNGNLVRKNLATDNAGDGLQVSAGLKANWLIDNTLKQNGHDGLDNWATGTVIFANTSKDNVGADIAGLGDGGGTVAGPSGGNSVKDGTGLASLQELELETLP
jgi:Right handed beta helix region